MELDPQLGAAEPDPEIQELIAASGGRNVALDFLPGSLTYNPAAGPPPDPGLAAEIVWLDALVTNVDRSPQNPNLLLWHGRLWLIDHGAALYLQHAWEDPPADAQRPFPMIRNHVLLPCAGDVLAADARLAPRLDDAPWSASSASCPTSGSRRGPARSTRSTCAAGSPPRAASPPRPRRRGVAPSPFQYAIVRVVPRVERGECLNAGVVLFCRPRRFLGARVALDEARLRALAPDADVDAVRGHLEAFRRIAAGEPDAGPIAALPASERFHWLVAPASTIIQCSPVHTGLSDDPEAELDRLVARLVT